MASSRVCTITTCKRPVRALCICCQQNLCIDHLKEHSDLINAQLSPLADEINTLFDQFNNLNVIPITFITELDKWREDAHRTVDQFYETKKQEFEEFVDRKRHQWETELERLRIQIHELIREQEATQEDIELINQSIRSIQQETNEYQLCPFIRSPLMIDDRFIVIQLKKFTEDDLLPLSPPCRTIKLNIIWSSIAASDNNLLVIQNDEVRLLDRHLIVQKEFPWSDGVIFDTFWSATLARFFVITPTVIFTLDEKTMTFKQCSITNDTQQAGWCRGACSHDALYLSTNNWGSSIYSYSLLPSLKLNKLFLSPISCARDENISDLSSNNIGLALMIVNNQKNEWHLDLCSVETLQRQWSVRCHPVLIQSGVRCRSLFNDQWMVIDSNSSALYHIAANGRFVKKEIYHPSPRHAIQFNDDLLAILTNDGVHLHRIP